MVECTVEKKSGSLVSLRAYSRRLLILDVTDKSIRYSAIRYSAQQAAHRMIVLPLTVGAPDPGRAQLQN